MSSYGAKSYTADSRLISEIYEALEKLNAK